MKIKIALFISIIALIFLVLFLRIDMKKTSSDLGGTIISDAIYSYDLETENLEVNGILANEEEIIYLLMETVDEENNIFNYKLKKLDIMENKVTQINEWKESNHYCTLKEENVYCLTSQDFQVYNLDLENIFSYESLETEPANYIPYKDIYVKVIEKEIYLIRNNKEELYRSIETDKILYYEDDYITEDNSYIILLDDEGNLYLYDINENKLTDPEKRAYFKYKDGVVFYDEESFTVYDCLNDEVIEYENFTQENYYYTGTLNQENSTFYLYDVIENILYIENLKEGTEQKIDTDIFSTSNPIAKLILTDHYLYIYILQDKNNFFVLDLENLELPTTNIKDHTNELLNSINNKIDNIKNTYHVNIKIKEDAIIKFPDFSAEIASNNELILESLDKIESILTKYNLEFFESFYQNGFNGLNLYLTGSLTPSDYETQASNPAAYSLTYNGEYMIVIDLNQPNIEELLCHELLHNLEFNLNNQNIKIFTNWNSYNPPNFRYSNSYVSSPSYNYTLTEEDKNKVYFIDYYSHTYATEDRARVFEKICSCNEDSIINNYPKLYEKGLYLEEEITKYYPSLSTTGLFNSLNEVNNS